MSTAKCELQMFSLFIFYTPLILNKSQAAFGIGDDRTKAIIRKIMSAWIRKLVAEEIDQNYYF